MQNALITGFRIRNGDAMRDLRVEYDDEAGNVEINQIGDGVGEPGDSITIDVKAIEALQSVLTEIARRINAKPVEARR